MGKAVPQCEAEISPFEFLPRLGRGARGLDEMTPEEFAAPMPQCERPGEFRVVIGAGREVSCPLCVKHAFTSATAYHSSVYTAVVDVALFPETTANPVQVLIFSQRAPSTAEESAA
jgi:hypothetical protein